MFLQKIGGGFEKADRLDNVQTEGLHVHTTIAVEKHDADNAVKVLELALPTMAEDERVLNALAELYLVTGKAEKATEMKARAQASANLLIR